MAERFLRQGQDRDQGGGEFSSSSRQRDCSACGRDAWEFATQFSSLARARFTAFTSLWRLFTFPS